MSALDALFEPIRLGPIEIKNRLFNPPHGTTLGSHGKVGDDLIAYHEMRAIGGVGLIVIEGMTLHPTYDFPHSFVYAGDDDVVPGLARLHTACTKHGTKVIGQLFHAGRAVRASHDGSRPIAYSASDIPDERYRIVPQAMPHDMIWEVIEAYVQAARRLGEAGLDGVEILASMGYLVSQFLNPHTNRRTDEFGGDLDGRMTFLRQILAGIRRELGADKTVGIRISLSEVTDRGMTPPDALAICKRLEADGVVDYFSVISGSSASPQGWLHVFPPMALAPGYVAADAAMLKKAVSKPVLVAGRINQPQLAAQILADGSADMIGMVRALITDPDLPNKARTGRLDDIRACIGCNQACVGHRLAHHPVSCIQNPVSGREREFGNLIPAKQARDIIIVGGGPAGMKAAVIAARRGHKVRLFEKARRLGGQVNLAQALPGRAEFGGVITNLTHELHLAGVTIETNRHMDAVGIHELSPDAVVIATGALPRLPEVDSEGAHIVDAWSVIDGTANIGTRAVIADWACDWTGLGVAEQLARDGCHVRLMSGGIVAGEQVQGTVRDHWIGILHSLGVEMVPYASFRGADADTAYFQHMTNGEPILCEETDTVVTCYAPSAQSSLAADLDGFDGELVVIGDAAAPRTVEEAVLEGFRVGAKL
jgi:2,4-dienoyl-CoA reductase-like NADH-dependent reductase (Old Yellow Enzyme family)